MINFLLLGLFLLVQNPKQLEIDYKKANINAKKSYYQVPRDELIFAKYQALEPLYFFQGENRGYGFWEPIINTIILELRNNKVPTFAEYLTHAKAVFYQRHKNYNLCRPMQRKFGIYKNLFLENKKNNHKIDGKFTNYSIPYSIGDKLGLFAMTTTKLKLIEKHKWPKTDIYNIKSLLDDEDFYTIQIDDMYSGIKQYIYLDGEESKIRNPKYSKDRVYQFVASTAEQIPLMLKGKRMDWVDISIWGDYYIQKLGIKENTMTVLQYSHTHPNLLGKDDYFVDIIRCTTKTLEELTIIINIINSHLKKHRGNKIFFNQVLKNYADKFHFPVLQVQDFYYTKGFHLSNDLIKGLFDVQ